MSESLMLVAMAEGCVASPSRNTLSMTDSSVLVVSRPQKAHQSFATIPAAMTSLPRFTVPACAPAPRVNSSLQAPPTGRVPGYGYASRNSVGAAPVLTTRGTCSSEDSSSWSSMDVFGWTRPPWLLKVQYEPTRTCSATV